MSLAHRRAGNSTQAMQPMHYFAASELTKSIRLRYDKTSVMHHKLVYELRCDNRVVVRLLC